MVYDFSSGFQTSTTEMYIFLGVLVAIIVVLLIARLIRPKTKPRTITPMVRRRVDVGRERIELSDWDQATIRRIAWVLKNPRNMNQILDDHGLFRRASQRAIREGLAAEGDVLSLARRIGVDTEGIGRSTQSTRKIARNARISVSDGRTRVIHGNVTGMSDTAVIVTLNNRAREFTAGTPIEVISLGASGVHRFQSRVLKRDKKVLYLMHADQVNFSQRRRFRRRQSQLTVDIVDPVGDGVPRRTRTEDISVGGAAVANPRRAFQPGSVLECQFHIGKGSPVTIPATVVRTSRRGRLAHLQFSVLDERTQYKVFRHLYTAGNRK